MRPHTSSGEHLLMVSLLTRPAASFLLSSTVCVSCVFVTANRLKTSSLVSAIVFTYFMVFTFIAVLFSSQWSSTGKIHGFILHSIAATFLHLIYENFHTSFFNKGISLKLKIGIVFLFIGNSRWCLYNTRSTLIAVQHSVKSTTSWLVYIGN